MIHLVISKLKVCKCAKKLVKMLLADILSPISATTATIVVLLSFVYYFMKNRDILPGPRGLPYFGLFFNLTDDEAHLQLQEYGKKYGDLFSFIYGGKLFINLGSAKAMREVHINKSDCFAGRFSDTFQFLACTLEDGVAFANGEAWKVLRKFFIKSFKEYGLSYISDNTKGPLYESVSRTIEDFREKEGKPINVCEVLTEKSLNTMRKILFGEDEANDKTLLKMNVAYADVLIASTGTNLLLMGPLGRILFKIKPVFRKALRQHSALRVLLKEVVEKAKNSMAVDHATCVVEDYFKERSIRKNKNDPTWIYFSDKALLASLSQMIGDGILGVASFIGLFLAKLVQYPEEQEKIYKELMEVVGPSRQPTLEDKNRLPYSNAFIYEAMRTTNFFALFPSLECTKETTVRGYRIPKGSITMLNIWQAHHDPGTYENPDKFDPSRFISSPHKPKAELPVQFGIGKRACIGESFTMNEAFLYVTSIVKNFTVSQPDTPAGHSENAEVLLMTGTLELCLKPRTEK